jgi:nucleotide-binding universal stress UspA family protein
METILIATDFSSTARNATKYGFELSKSLNAKVILFNAYQFPSTHPESMIYLPGTDLEKLRFQQLATEAETFDSHATVALETQCKQGPVGEAILSVAADKNVSVIVIGMKRTGKELRKYFGTTVTLLSKQSSIPVIVVPAGLSVGCVITAFRGIVLAFS